MDQGTREAGQVGTSGDTDRSPEEIQREIEQTRGELGDTVEALASKADVKGRAKERVDDLKGTAQQKKDEFVSKAKAQTPDSASTGAQQLSTKARENPLPFAVGGALVAGFLLGRLTSR
jgi:hypothetical protein